MTLGRLWWKIVEKSTEIFFQRSRVIFYSMLSNIKISARKNQPVLSNGDGCIKVGKNVVFGVRYANDYYTRYTLLNVRNAQSYIEIGDNCQINNNFTVISDGQKITVSKNCLIGNDVTIIDSDFHDLGVDSRYGGQNIIKKDVFIAENVFIGSHVTILKGVTIGKNSVVGSNTVVSNDVPENVIVVGNPAKVLRHL